MSCKSIDNFRDDKSYCQLSKKLKSDTIHDANISNDDYYMAPTIVSKNLHNEELDDEENISFITDMSEPRPSIESQLTGINNNNVLGAILNTLFPIKKCKKSNVRKISSKNIDCNATSLKIHPYLPTVEPKISSMDHAKYIIDRMYSFAYFVSTSNAEKMESTIEDIFLEDCTLKTPALSKPKIGRHYLVELFKSLIRSSMTFTFNLHDHEISYNADRDTVITFHHDSDCK